MRLTAPSFFIAAFFVIAGSAKAQFVQYTPPGGPEDRPEDRKERLEREIQQAPHRLGPFRIVPMAGLRNVAYVRNLFGSAGAEDSDFTATLAAGFRGYIHTGPKITWEVHALPEYVWWREQSEERRLNRRYGLTGYGFFNHLTVEVSGRRDERQQIVTPEVPRPANARGDRVAVAAELQLTGALAPFAAASQSRQRSLADDQGDPLLRGLGLLDREERLVRAGLRWRPRPGWMVGAGAERSQVDFENPALDASNEGTAPAVEFLIDRRRFFLQLDAAARSLEAREGSRFVGFDGVTGSLSVSVRPRRRLELWAHTSRNLVYTLSPSYAYVDGRITGLAVNVGLVEGAALRLFAETGGEDYLALSPSAPERADDVTSFGSSLRLTLPGSVDLVLRAVRSEFDSNIPGADRTYTSGGLTVSLGGDLGPF